MSYRKLATHPLHSLLRSAFTRAAAGALGAAAPLAVLANPTGGQVVGGTATIGSAGANGVVVTQGSQKAIINWQQFSVGSGQYVQFVQPNSSSVVLNRVTGSNPSSIFGDIIANGQVFLVNPNGVYFAPGASIDVQGLVASTLDLNDGDFMQGRYVFSKAPGAPDAGVVNAGGIHAGPGGYVVLAGDYANNSGAIVAQTGRVYLAAGSAATLTFDSDDLISYVVDGKTLSRLAGVSNTGAIAANGGLVVMTADVANTLTATAVNNSGLITAHSVTEHGGEIVLLAEGGDIENSGTLDASADVAGVAGGAVLLRGDGHTQLDPTSVIDAEGDQARGGFIELSGHTLSMHGEVTAGRGGSVLIDPNIINIISGPSIGANTVSGSVGTGYIASQLNLGVNITLVAGQKIQKTTGTAINATGTGNLALKIGTLAPGPGTLSGAACGVKGVCVSGTSEVFTKAAGGTINLSGLTIAIAGTFTASATIGTVTTGAVTAKAINLIVANGTLHVGNLTATGTGGVVLNASHGSVGVTSSAAKIVANAGPVTVTGAHVSLGSVSAGGKLKITAKAGGASPATVTIATGKVLTGKSVSISASGSYGGMITAGDITATNGSIFVHAHANNSHAASITALNLQAKTKVNISASGQASTIKVGTVTASTGNVNILAAGISAGSIHAGGSVGLQGIANNSAASAHVKVTGNVVGHTGVGIQATGPLGGRIHVTGSISASHSLAGVTLRASNTAIAANGGNIIVGTRIKAGSHASLSLFAKGGGASAGTIKVGGSISAGSASVVGHGHGGVSVGAITAKKGVIVEAIANGGAGGNVKVNGNVTGGSVVISGNDSTGGNVTVTGTITATSKNVFIGGNTSGGGQHAGGNINVGGAISAALGSVDIQASGRGANGGTVTVGNVTAKTGIDIISKYLGVSASSGHAFVQTGNLIGEYVSISAAGISPRIKTGSITANGTVSSATKHDFVDLTVTGGGVTGNISIGGPVLTSHGSVGINAGSGLVDVNSVTAHNQISIIGALKVTSGGVSLTGGQINIGSVSANTGNVVIKGTGSVNAGNIVAAAGGVQIQTNLGASSGGRIRTGNITGRSISLSATARRGAQISTGTLHATGGAGSGDISLFAHATGGVSSSGGNITVNGGITADHGAVSLNALGGQDSGGQINVNGAIKAAGNVSILAVGVGSCCDGTISIAGNVTGKFVDIEARQTDTAATSGAKISITGNVTATGTAPSASPNLGVTIAAGSAGAPYGKPQIAVTGNVTASHGAVNLSAWGKTSGGFIEVGHLSGGVWTSGAINAAQVGIQMHSFGTAGVHVGQITATGDVSINDLAQTDVVSFGPVTAGGAFTYKSKSSINLSGYTLQAGKGVTLQAATLNIGNAHITAGGAFAASAQGATGVLTAGSGSITATAMSLKSGGLLSLSGETLKAAGGAFAASAASLGLAGVNLTAGAVTMKATTLNLGNAVVTAGGAFAASAQGATGLLTAGSGNITATAISLKSGGLVSISGETLKVTGGGGFAASAGGSLGLTGVTLTAGAMTAKAGAILDLTSAHVNAGGAVTLTAAKHILLGKTVVKAGGAFSADAHGSISDGGSAGSITAAGATFKTGTGKLVLDGETLTTGKSKLAFSAAGNVSLNGANIHAGNVTVAAVGNLAMTSASVNAASMQAVTGGSIDLSGDTVVATGAVQLTAGMVAAKQPLAAKDIILSGVDINVGTFAAVAGGTIHNGGATGTLIAKGLALSAGKDINLSSTQVTVGNASLASLPSDTLLLQGLAAAGLSPATPKPNAYFNAGGTLTLGKFTLTGTYLYMQAANINVLGPVSTPADSVIQFAPTIGTASIGVEQNPGAGSVMNLSNSLLLSLFPGTTLVIGNAVESGAVTLGNNGPFNIGSSNLIIETSGTVTGLNNVTSTGLISTVQSLLASALVPPTPSEIDPNSNSNNNTAGKHNEGDYDPDAGTSGGTITQTSDTGGACH